MSIGSDIIGRFTIQQKENIVTAIIRAVKDIDDVIEEKEKEIASLKVKIEQDDEVSAEMYDAMDNSITMLEHENNELKDKIADNEKKLTDRADELQRLRGKLWQIADNGIPRLKDNSDVFPIFVYSFRELCMLDDKIVEVTNPIEYINDIKEKYRVLYMSGTNNIYLKPIDPANTSGYYLAYSGFEEYLNEKGITIAYKGEK
ncbi:hypothetical protein vBCtySFA70_00047 [Clostridium phage vB_CtyS-FA70]|nr:hypothetical protein vBCtySFA70_00047 [Clostridium phage vB_CtyS-FA70]